MRTPVPHAVEIVHCRIQLTAVTLAAYPSGETMGNHRPYCGLILGAQEEPPGTEHEFCDDFSTGSLWPTGGGYRLIEVSDHLPVEPIVLDIEIPGDLTGSVGGGQFTVDDVADQNFDMQDQLRHVR